MENFIDGGFRLSESEPERGYNNGAKAGEASSESAKSKPKEKPTQAKILVRLAADVQLFRNKDGEAFASFEKNGHMETYPLESRDFKNYLVLRFCEVFEKPPHSQALSGAFSVLEGRAMQNPKMWPVHVRVASGDGVIWLNLADEEWRVVQISASEGWRVKKKSPVYFRKPRGIRSLPEPILGGSVDELRKFVNVGSEDDFILLIHWLLAALNADGPYPILVLQGEQGSAKSTTAKIIRALLDPSASPIRSLPKSERDLLVSAKNGWVLSYDNISKLPNDLSDAFCRLATGGGLSPRRLYSDDDEVLLDAKRPVILNGIEELAVRSDLADRAIVLNLPTISGTSRRLERDLLREFYAARPRILGALLTAVQCSLANERTFKRPRYSRMADFHHRAVGATPVLPWTMEQFEAAYEENRKNARGVVLEVDPVARAVQIFMEDQSTWTGTATELFDRIEQVGLNENGWFPKTPNALSNRLTRLGPALRAVGIEIERGKRDGERYIAITRISQSGE
jgi:hypothetical protein